jgi:hypothetical protein
MPLEANCLNGSHAHFRLGKVYDAREDDYAISTRMAIRARLTRKEREAVRTIATSLDRRRTFGERPHLNRLPASYRQQVEAYFGGCAEEGDLEQW